MYIPLINANSNAPKADENPKLIQNQNKNHIACKLDFPTKGNLKPVNICIITAHESNALSEELIPTPELNQMGWLSFTNRGLDYLGRIGVELPLGDMGTGHWLPCDGMEHGNRDGAGITYNRGFYFGDTQKALTWLTDLLATRGQTIEFAPGFPKRYRSAPTSILFP